MYDDRKWALDNGAEFVWEDDWSVGSHKDFYGAGSAYEDCEPTTCEQVIMIVNGDVVGSLGCIDDADDAYRRQVEDDLADEYRAEMNKAWSNVDAWLALGGAR